MNPVNLIPLYRQHGLGLYAYARSLAGRRESAEDIVQTAFLRLLASESPLAPSPAVCLYAVVRSLGMESSMLYELHGGLEEEEGAVDVPPEPGWRSALLAELEDLPVTEREAVVLMVFGELTFEELGEILQVSAGTVALRYRASLETLSARLTPAVNPMEAPDLLRRIPDLVPSPDVEQRIVKSADRRKGPSLFKRWASILR